MPDVLFYHLEARPLEAVLPNLLEKTLERGWRAVVEVGSTERVASLDAHLWIYRDDSFLPHGVMGQGHEARQPVLLTTGTENANGAEVRFFVDRAVPREMGDYQRLVYLFSGLDPDAVDEARTAWKMLREQADVTYWQQDQSGRWSRKA